MKKILSNKRPKQWTKMIRKRWASINTTNTFAFAKSLQARAKPPTGWEKQSRESWMAVKRTSMKMIMTDQGPGQDQGPGPTKGLAGPGPDQEGKSRASVRMTASATVLVTKGVANLQKRSAERRKLSVKRRNRNS